MLYLIILLFMLLAGAPFWAYLLLLGVYLLAN